MKNDNVSERVKNAVEVVYDCTVLSKGLFNAIDLNLLQLRRDDFLPSIESRNLFDEIMNRREKLIGSKPSESASRGCRDWNEHWNGLDTDVQFWFKKKIWELFDSVSE